MSHSTRIAVISAFIFSGAALAAPTPFTVVIDPGHGGTDLGTTVHTSHGTIAEKDVTLRLAELVAQKLRARGIRAVLTRGRDREIPLASRTGLANRLKADVFLSIHMNSTHTGDTAARGIETYILNNTTDASSRRLAHLENSVISPTATDTPEEFDVAMILKDLRLDANIGESRRLACSVQNHLVSYTAGSSRGVKQALFHVLLGADMPSILVEAGFLTSPVDRARVLTPRGQFQISAGIARAIEHYKEHKMAPEKDRLLSRCKVN